MSSQMKSSIAEKIWRFSSLKSGKKIKPYEINLEQWSSALELVYCCFKAQTLCIYTIYSLGP